MKQHKHPTRHFLTGVMVLMTGLGAQGVRADALAEASTGLNDAPLSCSGALSSSIGAESLYFCQGALSIGKGTLSATQSIKITADGDITVTDLNTVTPQLIIESGKTINLLGSFSGTGIVSFESLAALGILQPIDTGNTLTIDPTHGSTQGIGITPNSDVTLNGGAGGSLVFSNSGNIVLGTTSIGGNLTITGLNADFQTGELIVSGSSSATALNAGSTIPEPGTWALMGLGLVGIAACARRRRA